LRTYRANVAAYTAATIFDITLTPTISGIYRRLISKDGSCTPPEYVSTATSSRSDALSGLNSDASINTDYILTEVSTSTGTSGCNIALSISSLVARCWSGYKWDDELETTAQEIPLLPVFSSDDCFYCERHICANCEGGPLDCPNTSTACDSAPSDLQVAVESDCPCPDCLRVILEMSTH
jgi:hypothetical protein